MTVTGHVASLEIVTDRRSRPKALVEISQILQETTFQSLRFSKD